MDKINEVMNAIRSYTNRAFIKGYKHGEFDTSELYFTDSIYEIRGSQYNDGFYYGEQELVDEVFVGYVVNIHVPISKTSLLAMNDSIGQLSEKGNVRREQVGDSSYTLDTSSSVGGVPTSMLQALNHYRVLPGGIEKEYFNSGIV